METIFENVPRYVANDGTKFNSEEECKNYDSTYKTVIENMFRNIPCKLVSCDSADENLSPDYQYIIIIPRNLNDVVVINMYMESQGNTNRVTVDHIGNELVFFRTYDGDVYFEDTVAKKIERYTKALSIKDEFDDDDI